MGRGGDVWHGRKGSTFRYDGRMETFNRSVLFSHVSAGLLALAIALVPIFSRKGGVAHRKTGRIYFWAMMWVMASAVILSCTLRFSFFLLGVTVLSFYETFTGARCLYLKGSVAANARGTLLDWSFTAATLIFGLGMAGYGLWGGQLHRMIALLTVLFAGLIVVETVKDVRRFLRPSSDPKWWWYYHMERMLGSWVAGLTALAVNQIGPRLSGNYRIWVWIGPALIMTPVITSWVWYYRRKFAVRNPSATASIAVTRSEVAAGTL